jgi:RimJ/RimL family protein N-acetyltransferase
MSVATPILETPRLALGLFRDEDLDFLAGIFADPEVMRFFPSVRTREFAAEQIAKYAATFAVRGFTL